MRICVHCKGYRSYAPGLQRDIYKEIAGHKNAREKLPEGLKEHGSFYKYLDNLAHWGKKERTRVMAEINSLESQTKNLAGKSDHLRNKVGLAVRYRLIPHFFRGLKIFC